MIEMEIRKHEEPQKEKQRKKNSPLFDLLNLVVCSFVDQFVTMIWTKKKQNKNETLIQEFKTILLVSINNGGTFSRI